MQTTGKRGGYLKSTVGGIFGLLALSALLLPLQAADQPKPGPEQKKLELWVGDWTYEGAGEVTPFSPIAGKFKGTTTSRMGLGGFFLQGESKDISDDGYVWQSVFLIGYDAQKKAYVFNGFENDGTLQSGTYEVSGNAWTTIGSRTGPDGKVYKTKCVTTFSTDGRSQTELMEYSPDNGKTWATSYRATFKKVSK